MASFATGFAVTEEIGRKHMATPRPNPANNKYLFADGFNGPAGSPPDPSKWNFVTGQQNDINSGTVGTYTDSESNCYVDGHSHLVLRAQSDHSSARLNTQGKFAHQYGSWQAKTKYSGQPGCWPAWWCVGNSYPADGEIDIFEVYGNGQWPPDTTVWSPNMNDNQTANVPAMSDGNWHIWQMDWVQNAGFTFFQDGREYLSVRPSSVPDWCYDSGTQLCMIVNIALGGSGGGTFSGTQWPVELLFDWIHVW
jgi:beta-glucanase (GH16 family)